MAERTPWTPDFPDVVIHAELEQRDRHPAYSAAKAGDSAAAFRLVLDLTTRDALQALSQLAGQRTIWLAAVTALEAQGFNAIPDAMAQLLAEQLGWNFDRGELRQVNKVLHTRADGWHRLVTQAEFAGEVMESGFYVLVDDHVGFGGTLANLRGYIEQRGGVVVGATTLTETRDARTLKLDEQLLQQLRRQHRGELEQEWQFGLGYGFDCFTRVEAGFLCRQRTADFVRRRMAQAAKKARLQLLGGE